MPWAAPIPAFGDISGAKLASVGLNPSDGEFLDSAGSELTGDSRRFHTLSSLHLSEWTEADSRQIRLMLESCSLYFKRNPYDRWFKPLEKMMSGTPFSLYSSGACHLDLVPYATLPRWGKLSRQQHFDLVGATADILPLLLDQSTIRVLVLNGKSVVQRFQQMTGAALQPTEMPGWSLEFRNGIRVRGFSYRGEIERLGSVSFAKPILVLGYNHNIPSTHGVTRVIPRNWLLGRR